jgi:hypothetical protein
VAEQLVDYPQVVAADGGVEARFVRLGVEVVDVGAGLDQAGGARLVVLAREQQRRSVAWIRSGWETNTSIHKFSLVYALFFPSKIRKGTTPLPLTISNPNCPACEIFTFFLKPYA